MTQHLTADLRHSWLSMRPGTVRGVCRSPGSSGRWHGRGQRQETRTSAQEPMRRMVPTPAMRRRAQTMPLSGRKWTA